MGSDLVKTENGRATPAKRGLELSNFADMVQFAECVAASGIAPKDMQRPESIIVALQMGAELGLPPMAALQNIAVINGRPSIWGTAMLGICRASGLFNEDVFSETFDGTGDALAAICTVGRIGAKPITRRFTVADAKRAGLWDKAGPWKQYPLRMLQMRARGWALNDVFPDVLRGFYSVEEARDIVDVDIEQKTASGMTLPKPRPRKIVQPAAARPDVPSMAEAMESQSPNEVVTGEDLIMACVRRFEAEAAARGIGRELLIEIVKENEADTDAVRSAVGSFGALIGA